MHGCTSQCNATGVIPIDRLTDVRAPVAVIVERVPRSQLQEFYGIKLPRPEPLENQNRYSSYPTFATSPQYVFMSGM